MNRKTKSGLKIISNNRKARYNYFFNEFFEAGIVLKGSEVKSLREGKVNISDSYALDHQGEIFLINSHISSYKESKVEIAVAKGKKQYDKRQVKKQRDWNREKARYFRKTS